MSGPLVEALFQQAADYVATKEPILGLKPGLIADNFQETNSQYSLAVTNYPNYQVAEITPNRSKLAQSYLISGTNATLALQESMLLAVHDMVDDLVGNNSKVDILDWINQFELGFPNFQVKLDQYSNQNLPWGMAYNDRPLLRPLTPISRSSNIFFFVLQLYPSRSNSSESYLISGDTMSCMTQAMSIMSRYQQLLNNSVGQWVGYPIEEDYRRYARNYWTIKFLLSTKAQPPFKPRNEYKKRTSINGNGITYTSPLNEFYPFRRLQIHMPLVDSELVTYQNIRKACGGDAGLTIGYWLAVTPIGIANQKGYGSIRVRGVDYLGAISNTQGFLKLLTQDIYVGDPTPSFLTECHASDVADGNDQILSEYTVYPNNVVITSSTVKQSTQSKTGSNGKAVTKVATSKLLPIWSDVEPPGFTSGLSSFLAKLT